MHNWKEKLYFCYDMLVPRFITEEVAYIEAEESYEILGPLKYQPEGTYDAIGTLQGFNLFGMMLFPKLLDFKTVK